MATRLGIYNEALRAIGERRLASLTENREPRRLLDDVWDGNGVRYCLERGQWNFAMRTVALEYTSSIEPPFGYGRAFTKPTDLVRICGLSAEAYFNNPLSQYVENAGYWFAEPDTIYVQYVSDDDQYGGDLSLWPETFSTYVAMHFATEIAPKLSVSGSKVQAVEEKAKKSLTDARSNDAMSGPTQFAPMGSWAGARLGGGRMSGRRGGRWE